MFYCLTPQIPKNFNQKYPRFSILRPFFLVFPSVITSSPLQAHLRSSPQKSLSLPTETGVLFRPPVSFFLPAR